MIHQGQVGTADEDMVVDMEVDTEVLHHQVFDQTTCPMIVSFILGSGSCHL